MTAHPNSPVIRMEDDNGAPIDMGPLILVPLALMLVFAAFTDEER